MDFTDMTLQCKECGQEFIWTEGEQRFYAKKGLVNQPSRCLTCRTNRRMAHPDETVDPETLPRQRVAYPVVCAECGRTTTVPFVPRGDRPVYCSTCFSHMQTVAPLSMAAGAGA